MGYVTIPDEFTSLGLNPSELIVLSLIYGYSQNKQGVFYGSRAFIQVWLGVKSHHTIDKILAKLVNMGLIEKGEMYENGIRRCTYRYQGKNCPGANNAPDQGKNCPDTRAKNAHNNKYDNKEIINNSLSNAHASENEDAVICKLQSEFKATLWPFVNLYSQDMLQAFEDYWAAPLQHPTAAQRRQGILLKYQEASTWNLAGRLRAWKRKDEEASARRLNGANSRLYGPRMNERGETPMVESMRLSRESLERMAEIQRMKQEERAESLRIEELEAYDYQG